MHDTGAPNGFINLCWRKEIYDYLGAILDGECCGILFRNLFLEFFGEFWRVFCYEV